MFYTTFDTMPTGLFLEWSHEATLWHASTQHTALFSCVLLFPLVAVYFLLTETCLEFHLSKELF